MMMMMMMMMVMTNFNLVIYEMRIIVIYEIIYVRSNVEGKSDSLVIPHIHIIVIYTKEKMYNFNEESRDVKEKT